LRRVGNCLSSCRGWSGNQRGDCDGAGHQERRSTIRHLALIQIQSTIGPVNLDKSTANTKSQVPEFCLASLRSRKTCRSSLNPRNVGIDRISRQLAYRKAARCTVVNDLNPVKKRQFLSARYPRKGQIEKLWLAEKLYFRQLRSRQALKARLQCFVGRTDHRAGRMPLAGVIQIAHIPQRQANICFRASTK